MWTELLLRKFNLRTAGDEGEEDKDEEVKDDQKDEDGDDDQADLSPEEYKKIIKGLRAENAKRRLKEKTQTEKMSKFEKALKVLGGEDEDENPEAQLDVMSQNYQSAVTRNAILELALENGISGSENLEYFEFLMGKALGSLEEGEEMTEDQLEEILTKCSKKGAGPANTSTKDSGVKGGKKLGDDKNTEVTQEEFNKMGITQKSLLFQKNPELYKKLMANSTVR